MQTDAGQAPASAALGRSRRLMSYLPRLFLAGETCLVAPAVAEVVLRSQRRLLASKAVRAPIGVVEHGVAGEEDWASLLRRLVGAAL